MTVKNISSFLCLCFAVLLILVSACAPRANRTAPQPQAGTANPDEAQRVIALVNEARQTARNCGASGYGAAAPLRWNPTLAAPALSHAQDMDTRRFFNHTGSDGSDVSVRVSRTGYSWSLVGENLAYSSPGFYTPESVVEGWLASPGHCANLMHPDFTEIAVVKYSGTYDFWVQVFATPQ